MENIDSLNFLKKAIIRDVFITRDEQMIRSTKGDQSQWIFDFRKILLKPDVLRSVGDIFYAKYKDIYPFQIGGLEVAAIPLIAGLVVELKYRGLDVNGFFIRKSRKKYGLLNMIEGEIGNEKIILVDDLINSGKSFIRQIEVIESLGKKVDTVFSILRFRDIEYYKYFADRNIKVVSLFTLNDFKEELGVQNKSVPEPRKISTPFERLWYFKSNGADLFQVSPKSKPAIDEEYVYVGSDQGTFWCLRQSDGGVVWSKKASKAKKKSILSSPALFKDLVIFGTYNGKVCALEKTTGKTKWESVEGDWIRSSPEVARNHGLVFIGLELGWWLKRGAIVALNATTGKVQWCYEDDGYISASPLFTKKNDLVICGSKQGRVYALSAKQGRLVWKFEVNGPIQGKVGVDEKLGLVVFGSASEDGHIYINDLHTGKNFTTIDTAGWCYGDVLVHDHTAYVSTLAKELYAIDLKSKKIKWIFETKGRIFASPVMVAGRVLIGCNDARLYQIDTVTGKEIGFFQTTERITNGVAYNPVTGHVFLPTFANEIYCLKENP